MKISVLTPTFNDSASIIKTLDSVLAQTYSNFEIIIINDGSTDDTEKVVKKYIKKHKNISIKYLYQENQDQLNALLHGSKLITGDLVFVLHSDDLLPDQEFFENGVKYFKGHGNIDAIIGDLKIINNKDQVANRWTAGRYYLNRNVPALVLLNNGCNIYGDVALHKAETFTTKIKNNYLTWNTPFWIDLENHAKMLNVHNVEFPMLKYRIHQENYVNSKIGKFNALNGELRTMVSLAKFYDLPLCLVQASLYQLLRRPIIRRLKLFNFFKPCVKNKPMPNSKLYKLLYRAIVHTYGKIPNNPYIKALLSFYNSGSERTITIIFKNEPIYAGKDIRIFAKQLLKNDLPPIYNQVLKEMKIGFGKIITNDAKKAETFCRFLNINPKIHEETKQ